MKEENIPGSAWRVNTSPLFNLCNGDWSFFAKMILLFIRTTGETITRMEEELAGKNYPAIAAYAHQLAPSCRQLEAKTLLSAVKKIEVSIKEKKSYEYVCELVERAKSETEQVMEQLFVEIKNAGFT